MNVKGCLLVFAFCVMGIWTMTPTATKPKTGVAIKAQRQVIDFAVEEVKPFVVKTTQDIRFMDSEVPVIVGTSSVTQKQPLSKVTLSMLKVR